MRNKKIYTFVLILHLFVIKLVKEIEHAKIISDSSSETEKTVKSMCIFLKY